MSELKPCPFCGGEAQTNEVVGMSNENPPFGWGWVGCQKCRVFMQYNHGERGKRQAVEAWNRRADQQQPGATSANDRQTAWALAEIRERLKKYEESGLEPEEVKSLKEALKNG